jgi:hypothetical protein
MPQAERARRGRYRSTALALGVVLVGLVVFQYALQGAARRYGLVATPEPFTELYFARPAHLPSSASALGPLAFTFVIVNRHETAQRYAWRADFVEGRRRDHLAGASVRVAAGHSRQIAVSASPGLTGSGEIEVRIDSTALAIDFHVRLVGHPAVPTSGTRRTRRT